MRCKIFLDDRRLIQASQVLSGKTNSTIPEETRQLRDLIRWSNNPRIIYELIPNLSIYFKKHLLITNSEGFRGPEYPENKPENTIRIVGLGDSYMFGWRVEEDEYYLFLLSDYLNRNSTNWKFEVINMAVPGYNTAMEVESLEEKGLRYHPDLVVVHFTNNDMDLPNFIREKADYFTIRKSYLIEFLENRIRNSLSNPRDIFIRSPRHISQHRFENDPDRVPDKYKTLVGEGAYFLAMKQLKSLSLEHDFELILFSDTFVPKSVEEICSSLKIPIIEAGNAIQEFMSKHNIKRFKRSIMVISKNDDHPSSVSNRLYAEVIYDYLQKNGVIKKIIKKSGR